MPDHVVTTANPTEPGTNPPAPANNPPAPAANPPAPTRRAPAEGMTAQGLTERLKRERETERRRVLQDLGIEDPEKAKAELAEYQTLKQQTEERRRAEMTEIERYKADLAQAHAERDAAREDARQAHVRVEDERRDALIRQTAGKYVDERFIRTARVEFKAYVESLTPAQQAKLSDQQMEIWMRKFAKENPEFSRKPGDTTKPSPTPVLKKPLTNGATPRRTVKPGEGAQQPAHATAANPGGKHARDMSSQEVAQLARSAGLKSYKPSPSPRRSVN